jgi:hypothetical protein
MINDKPSFVRHAPGDEGGSDGDLFGPAAGAACENDGNKDRIWRTNDAAIFMAGTYRALLHITTALPLESTIVTAISARDWLSIRSWGR